MKIILVVKQASSTTSEFQYSSKYKLMYDENVTFLKLYSCT